MRRREESMAQIQWLFYKKSLKKHGTNTWPAVQVTTWIVQLVFSLNWMVESIQFYLKQVQFNVIRNEQDQSNECYLHPEYDSTANSDDDHECSLYFVNCKRVPPYMISTVEYSKKKTIKMVKSWKERVILISGEYLFEGNL